MNNLVYIVLLALGVVLLVYGVIAADSVSSDISRLFTGEPTNKTIWLLLGGIVAACVGAVGLFRGSRSTASQI